jgi:hypothetical protein
MRRSPALAVILSLALLHGCTVPGPPRSRFSFDQIRALTAGKSARELADLLGPPDAQERVSRGEQRWIWWNYTSLQGEHYSPGLRGKVVHLLVVVGRPEGRSPASPARGSWRVKDSFAVSYALAGAGSRAAGVSAGIPQEPRGGVLP